MEYWAGRSPTVVVVVRVRVVVGALGHRGRVGWMLHRVVAIGAASDRRSERVGDLSLAVLGQEVAVARECRPGVVLLVTVPGTRCPPPGVGLPARPHKLPSRTQLDCRRRGRGSVDA